ncbi:MAG: hypothetical protein C4321_05700, partial [Chloroflexota bacterium]
MQYGPELHVRSVAAVALTFSGAVLTGGRSSRMGRDKAFVALGGRPLVTYPVGALRMAGATEVFAVGGDRVRLTTLGLSWVPDGHPGAGPLGGICTAIGA